MNWNEHFPAAASDNSSLRRIPRAGLLPGRKDGQEYPAGRGVLPHPGSCVPALAECSRQRDTVLCHGRREFQARPAVGNGPSREDHSRSGCFQRLHGPVRIHRSFCRSALLGELHEQVLRAEPFYLLYLLLATGMLGMMITGDLFNFFIFIEISSIASFGLIASGETSRRPLKRA